MGDITQLLNELSDVFGRERVAKLRAEIERLRAENRELREAVELRDAYIRAIGADVDKAVALGAKYLGWE